MAGNSVVVRIDGDDSGFEKKLSGIGDTAKKTLGAAIKGAAAATAAVGALATAAVKGYADLEQLVGGVETLFGTKGAKSVEEYAESVGKSVTAVQGEYAALTKSQEKVLDNAKNAYKTAGLSANEYMETVTSFAASLKQSFADTPEGIEAAGEAADKAIQDMADNSNKMGTAMESIQMAYQGFAKQNYTMLDNLKLGYGGTRTEMERLLADATKLSGVKYDINNLADVYEAIHVIQEEIGITGTTAKEAEYTITGSVNMMKAAWKNLITGIADENADLDKLIDNFIDSLMTVGRNILPVFETALSGIGEFVTMTADKIIPKMVSAIVSALPSLATAAVSIITALANAIIDNLPLIIDAAKQIVTTIATELGNAAPVLKPITDLIQILASNIESIIPVIGGAVVAYGLYKVAIAAATVAQTAFNIASMANPVGLAIAAIGAVVGLTAGYLTATREQTEAEKEVTQAIKGRVDALNELKQSGYENASAAETEAAATQNLVSELKDIVDENGKIKDGYEARASVITGELNSALGTEMTIIDGVIQKYQEEMSTIDQLIEKKRASAIVDAERPQYTAAVQGYNDALKQQTEIQQQIAEQQAIIDNPDNGMATVQAAFEALEVLEEQLAGNEALIDEYTYTISAYEQNMEALAEGAYDTIKSINDATAKEISNASTVEAAQAAVKTAIATYAEGLASCERQGVEMTSSMQTSIANNIKDAILKVAELGGEVPEGISIGIENGKAVILNSTEELIDLLCTGLENSSEVEATAEDTINTPVENAVEEAKGTAAQGGQEVTQEYNANLSALNPESPDFVGPIQEEVAEAKEETKSGSAEIGNAFDFAIVEGIQEKGSEIGTAASTVVAGANTEATEETQKANQLGEDWGQGYADGIRSKIPEISDAGAEAAAAASSAAQEEQDSNSPAKESMYLGNDWGDGYVVGIEEKETDAAVAASGVVNSAIEAAESAVKTGRVQLGNKLWMEVANPDNAVINEVKSTAEEITEEIKKAYSLDDISEMLTGQLKDGIKEASDELKDSFDKEKNVLEKMLDFGVINEKEYYSKLKELRDKYFEAGTEEWYEYTKEISEGHSELIQEEIAAIEDGYQEEHDISEKFRDSELVDDTIFYYDRIGRYKEYINQVLASTELMEKEKSEIIAEYENQIKSDFLSAADSIIQQQNAISNNLKGYGSLYYQYDLPTLKGNTTAMTATELSDISRQNETLEEYYNLITKLKERAEIPEELLSEIYSMSVPDAMAYVKALLREDDEGFAEYIGAYNQKQSLSDNIAKALTADDTQKLKDEFIEKFGEIPEDFFAIGEESAERYGEGFMDALSGVLDNIKTQIDAVIGNLLPQDILSFAGGGTSYTSYTDSRTTNIYAQGSSAREIVESQRAATTYQEHTSNW